MMNYLESRPRVASALAIGYAGFIFLISAMPRPPRLPHPDISNLIFHVLEYLIFGILLIGALRSRRVRENPALLAISIGVIYAVTDEAHQYFVPNRFASLLDIIADSIGTIIGVKFYESMRHK